ncbi:hypothetical protein NM74_06895 [Aeromonas hydrophila]|nr:hypothetical protein NM74_06895 [Aeromonas hydrophila]
MIVLLFWGMAMSVSAQSIMIPITGYIGENSCSVSTASKDVVVDLGTVSTQEILNNGQSKLFPFKIKLEECGTAAVAVKIKFTGSADNIMPGLFKVDDGGAKGVAIEILSPNLSRLEPGKYGPALALTAGSENILNFYARYNMTSTAIEAGAANAKTTFTLEYQ